jgi:hypothetical protein
MSVAVRRRPPLVGGLAVMSTLILLASSHPSAEVRSRAPACTRAEYHEFDFFLGEWDAFDVGSSRVKAHNSVTRMIDGCAIREVYRRLDGYSGESFSMYDSAHARWHQSWVTNTGELLLLDGGMRDSAMVLTGNEPVVSGAAGLIRGTWRPSSDGSVRETAERSVDNGKSWTGVFDLVFRRPKRSAR